MICYIIIVMKYHSANHSLYHQTWIKTVVSQSFIINHLPTSIKQPNCSITGQLFHFYNCFFNITYLSRRQLFHYDVPIGELRWSYFKLKLFLFIFEDDIFVGFRHLWIAKRIVDAEYGYFVFIHSGIHAHLDWIT